MAPYAQHIVIATGKSDWKSRIEDEEGYNVAQELKALLGPKGRFHDPYNNILITNSSFEAGRSDMPYSTVRIYPRFRKVQWIPHTAEAIEALVRQFILPHNQSKENVLDSKLQNQHDSNLYKVSRIEFPQILICSHSSRDTRCGITGPLLYFEFMEHHMDKISRFPGARRPSFISEKSQDTSVGPVVDGNYSRPGISMISHIGGHAFAGNVIIYFPPSWRLPNGKVSSLAGKGIWYGRVEPKHVEGICTETILRGKVIKELFRGGVGQGGQSFRL